MKIFSFSEPPKFGAYILTHLFFKLIRPHNFYKWKTTCRKMTKKHEKLWERKSRNFLNLHFRVDVPLFEEFYKRQTKLIWTTNCQNFSKLQLIFAWSSNFEALCSRSSKHVNPKIDKSNDLSFFEISLSIIFFAFFRHFL